MNAFDATLGPVDVQAAMPKINLRPSKRAKLSGAEAVTIRK
jgi:hypothetical protein